MMKRGRFDEQCPHCYRRIYDLHQKMIDADYQSEFTFPCPHCSTPILCNVHQVPEFELSKPETPEEYQEKLKRLKAAVNKPDVCATCRFRPCAPGQSRCEPCAAGRLA